MSDSTTPPPVIHNSTLHSTLAIVSNSKNNNLETFTLRQNTLLHDNKTYLNQTPEFESKNMSEHNKINNNDTYRVGSNFLPSLAQLTAVEITKVNFFSLTYFKFLNFFIKNILATI